MTPLSKKELEEIRERLGRVIGRCDLSATPALMSPDNLPQNPRVWYDDGDLCAEVWENLGLDIDGDAVAEIFAHAIADGKRLLETIEHLQKYQQHLPEDTIWPEIAQMLLNVRDALVRGDDQEAYHWLYLAADRGRLTVTPWDEWERLKQSRIQNAFLEAVSTPSSAATPEEGESEVEMHGGCGYQGYEFGATYPDSVCLDGWLFDADSGYSIPEGWAYTHGGDIPCPNCNADEHLPPLEIGGS